MIWKRTQRTKRTKKWIEETDPIRLTAYQILIHVKILVIALVVYLFVLTISEGVFTLQGVGDHAVGRVQRPWLTNPIYQVSDQSPSLELSSETTNM